MKTKLAKALCLFLCGAVSAVYAGSPFDIPMAPSDVAPHQHTTALLSGPAIFPYEFRSIDGTGNNPIDPLRGSAGVALLRHTTIGYGDGSGTPAGADQRSTREISNLVCAQTESLPNPEETSDYLWQWGQFIDHGIDLTPAMSPAEPFNIPVPLGDPWFDPEGTGTQVIGLDRSLYQMVHGVRQQLNVITAFIDGSQVYGSDEARALELRTLDGSGRLKVSEGNLLPYNIHGFPNLPDNSPTYFLAGDVRANEQVGLTTMHTLFVREHNYWARLIRNNSPTLMTTVSTTGPEPLSARRSRSSPTGISSRGYWDETRFSLTPDTTLISIRESRTPSRPPPIGSAIRCCRLFCSGWMRTTSRSAICSSAGCLL